MIEKKATKRSADGQRVMSFADPFSHLGTFTRNTMRVSSRPKHRFTLYSTLTPVQETAFRLLDTTQLLSSSEKARSFKSPNWFSHLHSLIVKNSA